MKRIRQFFFYSIILSGLVLVLGITLIPKKITQSLIQETTAIIQNKLGIKACSQPKTFAIGNIDSRFDISRKELVLLSKQAANIWNKAEGKTILQYDENSPFKINLVFDQRQSRTLIKEDLEKKLKELTLSNDKLAEQYTDLYNDYKRQIDYYEKDLKKYKVSLENYNKAVSYWNEQGGAPEDEYKKLKKEKDNLQDTYKELEKQRKKINQLSDKTNVVVNQEKQVIDQYNTQWVSYKSEFGEAREFEKGVFNTKEIDIYQFQKKSDLLLTLAHEMGHYLGMQHVQNSQSIMYYLLGNQNLTNPTPTIQDKEELKRVCGL